MAKRDFANVMSSGLAGAGTGAAIGTEILPGWGTAIGGGIGLVAGGIGGYFASKANEPYDAAQLGNMQLGNEISAFQLKDLKDKKAEEERRKRMMQRFSNKLGTAFSSARKPDFGRVVV